MTKHQMFNVLAGGKAVLVANPVSIRPISKTHAVYVAEGLPNQPMNEASFSNVLASVSKSMLSVVPDTLFRFEDKSGKIYMKCIVAVQQARQSYSDEIVKNMRVINANVFQDSDDNIWKIVSEGDEKYLVRSGTKDDFDSIFNERLNRKMLTASAAMTKGVVVEDNDYVLYFNPVTAQLDSGFYMTKTDGNYVFSRNSGELVKIESDLILEALYFDEPHIKIDNKSYQTPAFVKASSLIEGDFNFNSFLDYMRQIYANTGFFKQMEKSLKERAI